MELPTYFTKFLQGIRPTENQKDDCKTETSNVTQAT